MGDNIGGEMMAWTSWNDFFAMGGYAFYVWGSVLVVFGFIAGELLQLSWRKKAILTVLSITNSRTTSCAASTKVLLPLQGGGWEGDGVHKPRRTNHVSSSHAARCAPRRYFSVYPI